MRRGIISRNLKEQSSVVLLLADPLDFLHVWGLLVAGDEEEDEGEQGPGHEGNVEYVVFVEGVVEPHVVDLHSEDHVDLGVPGVGGEGTDAQLDDPHRGDAEQDHVEQETVHPSLILLHGVETAAEGQSYAKLDVPFLHTPQHVEAEVGENESTHETGIVLFHVDEQLVKPGQERPIFGIILDYVAEDAEQGIGYIWMIHMRAVMKKMMPRISLRKGMMGLVSAYFSSKLNTWNSSLRAQYFDLNSVSLLLTLLLPLYFSKQPASSFLLLFSSISFTWSPYFMRLLMACTMRSFVFFIYSVLRGLGRCLNSLIISMGRANSPTPPNSTRNIHPKKDRIAMMQTARETVRVIILSEEDGFGTPTVSSQV